MTRAHSRRRYTIYTRRTHTRDSHEISFCSHGEVEPQRRLRVHTWKSEECVVRLDTRQTMIKSSSVVAKSSGTKCTRATRSYILMRACACAWRWTRWLPRLFSRSSSPATLCHFSLSCLYFVYQRFSMRTHAFIIWFILFTHVLLSPLFAHRWIDHWRWKRRASKREIENCHRNRKRRRAWAADACQSAAIIWEWAIWWNRWIHPKHFRVAFQLQWVSFEAVFHHFGVNKNSTDDLLPSASIFIAYPWRRKLIKCSPSLPPIHEHTGQHSHLSGSLHPAHAHMHGGWYASGMSALGASGGLQGGFSSSGLGGGVVPHSQSYHLMVSTATFFNSSPLSSPFSGPIWRSSTVSLAITNHNHFCLNSLSIAQSINRVHHGDVITRDGMTMATISSIRTI